MKKICYVFLIFCLTFVFSSCNAKEEYAILDENLVPVEYDDNHRVYYEIFLGSFSDGNEDGMGDFRGLINRLDYLNDGDSTSGKSLGIEGIWLMPIMPSPSYHKYDVTNYMAIDDDYGTIADFEEFIAECDARGIDVIIDLVLNHTSSQHPWFRSARNAMQSGEMDNPYLEYYTLVTEENKESGKTYHSFSGDYFYEGNFSASMPELNLDSDLVRQEIEAIIAFWYDLGVKGFRLDAAKYPYLNDDDKNIEFWNWFVEECKKHDPDAYIVGEVWSGDSLIIPYYESFSNFDFGMSQSQGAIAMVANNMDDVNWYVQYITTYRNRVENVNQNAVLTPFISNHDMNRAAGFLSVEDYSMHVAASLYLLTYGTPFIYYGEEIGMKGSRGTENTDANRRLKMLWGDKDKVESPIGATYSEDLQTNGTVRSQIIDSSSLYNHYKKLIMLRQANPEIARGEYTPLTFEGYYYFGGFLSTYDSNTVGVFHNTGEEPIVIDLSDYTDHTFAIVSGYAGLGEALLEGQILTISGKTSVVLK
ncbi:MAG: alpha-amylase [Bacilli bacterium]|nr:alpha-amylase [Bacilli bacterium]MBN2696738.1 alpha-amylase [Bacilli bacterium]